MIDSGRPTRSTPRDARAAAAVPSSGWGHAITPARTATATTTMAATATRPVAPLPTFAPGPPSTRARVGDGRCSGGPGLPLWPLQGALVRSRGPSLTIPGAPPDVH